MALTIAPIVSPRDEKGTESGAQQNECDEHMGNCFASGAKSSRIMDRSVGKPEGEHQYSNSID